MLQDKLLVFRCKHGNSDALCRIYAKYKDYLLTLAKGLLNDHAEAQDVVHDVFVIFARSVKELKLTGSLRGYLATCVCNRARDIIRSRTRQTAVYSDLANPMPLQINSPEQCVIKQEELARLRQAIAQIPYEQREVVILHIKGGMKFSRIANLQNVSVSTIHGRYRYGLDKLRLILNSEEQK
jgi:RNA polymerase sigma-70 factor (ECF subfamily)